MNTKQHRIYTEIYTCIFLMNIFAFVLTYDSDMVWMSCGCVSKSVLTGLDIVVNVFLVSLGEAALRPMSYAGMAQKNKVHPQPKTKEIWICRQLSAFFALNSFPCHVSFLNRAQRPPQKCHVYLRSIFGSFNLWPAPDMETIGRSRRRKWAGSLFPPSGAGSHKYGFRPKQALNTIYYLNMLLF